MSDIGTSGSDASRPLAAPDAQRILIIRPSALGDVCRSVPVLASLRRAYPTARIDWLVRRDIEQAVKHHPGLTGVVPFDRAVIGRALWRGDARPLRALLAQLRGPRYDLVIDAQGLLRSGLMALATGAKVRVGWRDARELAWLCSTVRVPAQAAPRAETIIRPINQSDVRDDGPSVPEGPTHTVERMLHLVSAIGVEPVRDLGLYTSSADRAWASQSVSSAADTGPGQHEQIVVLAPTSLWPAKRWPIERFRALADALIGSGRTRVVIVGGAGERCQCAPLLELAKQDSRAIDLVGGTSVGQLMAIIERASLVVANDSAALHMAVGLGRPIVGLFGPTDVSLVGPYGRSRDVLQKRDPSDRLDHKRPEPGTSMMARITVDEVLARAKQHLAGAAGVE